MNYQLNPPTDFVVGQYADVSTEGESVDVTGRSRSGVPRDEPVFLVIVIDGERFRPVGILRKPGPGAFRLRAIWLETGETFDLIFGE